MDRERERESQADSQCLFSMLTFLVLTSLGFNLAAAQLSSPRKKGDRFYACS